MENPDRPISDAADPAIFQTLDRTARFPYSRSEYIRRFAWAIVQATLFRLPLPRLNGWRCFLLRLFGAKLEHPLAISSRVNIIHPWLLSIGKWSAISHGVTIYNLGPVSLGRHSVISQDVYLCAGTHDYRDPTLPLQRQPITIGDGVWIAAGAFIGPNVTIGDNSVIGARAVVMKDAPAGMVLAGNPAQVIKPRIPPSHSGRGPG